MQLHPKKIPIVENVWEQIAKHNILEDNHISKVMAETSDNKMIKVLRNFK